MLNTYLAPGVAENVNFTLHPAVRPGTGLNNSWSCPKGKFECPDEDCDCPYTRWELCSIHASKVDLENQIRFMTCYDSQNIAYSSDWAPLLPSPMRAAQICLNQTVGLASWQAVQDCGGMITGDWPSNYTYTPGVQSDDLITEAAKYFYDTFPTRRGIENAKFHVPNLYINNQPQDLNNLVNMWNTTLQLCNNGAKSAAVCTGISQAKKPVWTGSVLVA